MQLIEAVDELIEGARVMDPSVCPKDHSHELVELPDVDLLQQENVCSLDIARLHRGKLRVQMPTI